MEKLFEIKSLHEQREFVGNPDIVVKPGVWIELLTFDELTEKVNIKLKDDFLFDGVIPNIPTRTLENKIFIIFIVILLFLSIFFLNGCNGVEENKIISYKVLLGLRDGNGDRINGSYSVGYFNNSIYIEVSKGGIEDTSFVEFLFPTNQTMIMHTWNNNHYVLRDYVPGEVSDLENKSKLIIEDNSIKISNITISSDDKLKLGKNNLTINISVINGVYRQPMLCLDWTSGILFSRVKNTYKECDIKWSKCSKYENGKCVEYLGLYNFRCGDDIELCDKLENNNLTCMFPTPPIPDFIKAKHCYYLAYTLANDYPSSLITIDYESYALDNDKIIIYLLDRDRDISSYHIKLIPRGEYNIFEISK